MFKRIVAIALACLLTIQVSASAQTVTATASEQQPQTRERARELLTDAAIVALIIAASVGAYKAMGKPCACPSDTARNGSQCGDRSAWSRPGGFKPLCFPTDVTSAMIDGYRVTGAVPALK